MLLLASQRCANALSHQSQKSLVALIRGPLNAVGQYRAW